jgi:hypothetical protein
MNAMVRWARSCFSATTIVAKHREAHKDREGVFDNQVDPLAWDPPMFVSHVDRLLAFELQSA